MIQIRASYSPDQSITLPRLEHHIPPIYGQKSIIFPRFTKRYKRPKSLLKERVSAPVTPASTLSNKLKSNMRTLHV